MISPLWLSTGDTGVPGSAQLSNRKTRDMKYFQSHLQRVTHVSVQGVKSFTGTRQGEGHENTFESALVLAALGIMTTALPPPVVAGREAPAAMLEVMERLEGSRVTQRALEEPEGL